MKNGWVELELCSSRPGRIRLSVPVQKRNQRLIDFYLQIFIGSTRFDEFPDAVFAHVDELFVDHINAMALFLLQRKANQPANAADLAIRTTYLSCAGILVSTTPIVLSPLQLFLID